MPEFNIEDTEGIKEYVRSLDVYKQFDEVIVDQILQYTVMGKRPIEVEIKIFANDRLFYTHTERRLFTEPIVQFNRYFEKDVKDLSNALVLGRSIVAEVEELTDFTIFSEGYSSGLVVSKTLDSQYNLYVNRDSDDAVTVSVLARYKIDCGTFTAQHDFKTKRVIELDELKSVLEYFKSLRDKIAAEKISS